MERSDPKAEDRRTKITDSSRQGSKGYREWARDLHHITQHQARAGGGTGDCAALTTARQHLYRGLAGYETHQGHPNAIEFRLQGMGDGGG